MICGVVAVLVFVCAHIVGLGDRHGENLLIDEKNGECVHVDFDCLFDKGKTLETPERVPFRLTQNVIDGFGVCACEGVFRSSCEETMRVLRDNSHTLVNVLHSFLHDPLLEWKRTTANGTSASAAKEAVSRREREMEREKDRERDNVYAMRILSSIEMRLNGQLDTHSLPLSVQGQVYQLIEQARSTENLCRMYIGWMAWL